VDGTGARGASSAARPTRGASRSRDRSRRSFDREGRNVVIFSVSLLQTIANSRIGKCLLYKEPPIAKGEYRLARGFKIFQTSRP
jgi:hypothetical protein